MTKRQEVNYQAQAEQLIINSPIQQLDVEVEYDGKEFKEVTDWKV